MKIRILPMLTQPEPSTAPVTALVIAFIAAASLTGLTALLLARF